MTSGAPVRDSGFDDFLDALADGDGYYLECSNGHGSFPPRRACRVCGETDLEQRTLPSSGTVETFTIVRVPTPQFEGETPYVTAITAFGSVRLTGIVRDVDPDSVERGLTVEPSVERWDDDTRRLTFEPR
ncbi:OB-fold domain-containing protein [Halomicroarcula sp. F13]|uniref:OB-fold domain-containing protein n=1 Tax=Haloarcula rubra TaxID=2487747 RepID=A0AAW4PYJ4_9EURY|nr:OB-fold domain-containing protein [Halomicroarcula rubra]MBX0325560.1 OB-fold domain-containing protein [Halomicroarcula rubra]